MPADIKNINLSKRKIKSTKPKFYSLNLNVRNFEQLLAEVLEGTIRIRADRAEKICGLECDTLRKKG